MENIDHTYYINEFFCRCYDGRDYSYGMDCSSLFSNPCVNSSDQHQKAHPTISEKYFIHCTNGIPHLFKCPADLAWNDELKTCHRSRGTRRTSATFFQQPSSISTAQRQISNTDQFSNSNQQATNSLETSAQSQDQSNLNNYYTQKVDDLNSAQTVQQTENSNYQDTQMVQSDFDSLQQDVQSSSYENQVQDQLAYENFKLTDLDSEYLNSYDSFTSTQATDNFEAQQESSANDAQTQTSLENESNLMNMNQMNENLLNSNQMAQKTEQAILNHAMSYGDYFKDIDNDQEKPKILQSNENNLQENNPVEETNEFSNQQNSNFDNYASYSENLNSQNLNQMVQPTEQIVSNHGSSYGDHIKDLVDNQENSMNSMETIAQSNELQNEVSSLENSQVKQTNELNNNQFNYDNQASFDQNLNENSHLENVETNINNNNNNGLSSQHSWFSEEYKDENSQIIATLNEMANSEMKTTNHLVSSDELDNQNSYQYASNLPNKQVQIILKKNEDLQESKLKEEPSSKHELNNKINLNNNMQQTNVMNENTVEADSSLLSKELDQANLNIAGFNNMHSHNEVNNLNNNYYNEYKNYHQHDNSGVTHQSGSLNTQLANNNQIQLTQQQELNPFNVAVQPAYYDAYSSRVSVLPKTLPFIVRPSSFLNVNNYASVMPQQQANAYEYSSNTQQVASVSNPMPTMQQRIDPSVACPCSQNNMNTLQQVLSASEFQVDKSSANLIIKNPFAGLDASKILNIELKIRLQ